MTSRKLPFNSEAAPSPSTCSANIWGKNAGLVFSVLRRRCGGPVESGAGRGSVALNQKNKVAELVAIDS